MKPEQQDEQSDSRKQSPVKGLRNGDACLLRWALFLDVNDLVGGLKSVQHRKIASAAAAVVR